MYGTKLVLPGRRADSAFLHALIVEHDITVAPPVPTIFLDLLRHCQETGTGLGRLNRLFSGGTAPPLSMMRAYLRDYGVRTIHGWGMTETTSGATMCFAPRGLPPDIALAAMRTQGKAVFGAAIRIADETGTVLARDGVTTGHLQVRGHWSAEGYFRRPEVEAMTEDGWLQTGDVAKIDPDNTLHLVDRSKDVIKSGGEWISSQALEDAATRHPAVREAAVIAIPHPRWQERPLLVGVRAEPVTEQELIAHLAAIVPKWWLPDSVAFVRELPHGPTGKLAKQALRQWLADGRFDITSGPTTTARQAEVAQMRIVSPENVCSRLLSLLQSVSSQTFSVEFRAPKKARFRAVLRVGLGVRRPERYGESLSERRFLSEAWGLADLLYKFFPQHFQCKEIYRSLRSWCSVRSSKPPRTFASAPG
jgi:acyl-CoA synthetase (AMP-forming)/AMP-acid ligase II